MILDGRTAVVTGGGRGIGAAVARALAAAGARVVVSARSHDQIDAVARDLGADRAVAIPCDVTDPDQVHRLAREVADRCGRADILVNNAGVAHSAPLKSLTLAEWHRLFEVNVTGTFLVTQAFLPPMVEAGWGRVVNVASIAGKAGAPYISLYASTKHAVVGFTRSVGAEVAARGVTVNAVCPGYVDTDMTLESISRIVGKTGITEEQAREHILRTNPQHRLIEAEEVAHAVVALCHPLARGINGQSIVIDGGAVQA